MLILGIFVKGWAQGETAAFGIRIGSVLINSLLPGINTRPLYLIDPVPVTLGHSDLFQHCGTLVCLPVTRNRFAPVEKLEIFVTNIYLQIWRNSHKRLVVGAHFLDVDVILGVNVRLQRAITLSIGCRIWATDETSCVLQSTLAFQPGSGCASVTMPRLQNTWVLLPSELQTKEATDQ